MLGGIYTTERCPDCGMIMQDNGRNAVACPKHKKKTAHRLVVRFGRLIKKRFSSYDDASRFLTGLRFKTDEHTFDVRDYQSGNPLAFRTMAGKYLLLKELEMKRKVLSAGTYKHIRCDLSRAIERFDTTSVKDVRYADLQLFLFGLEGISPKTIANIRTNLAAFWQWLIDSKEIRPEDAPKMPEVNYELGWRQTISRELQERILQKIKEQNQKSPRVYLAFQFLTTYTSIRPGELLDIKEEDVRLDIGHLIIQHHKTARKTKSPRVIPLLPEDIDAIKILPRGFAKMPFFRHDASVKGMPANTPFGNRLLRKVWNRACKELGVEGVDLYGGTRHSTQQFYKQFMSAEDCQRLSMHTTSKAGMRYLEVHRPELMAGYSLARREGTPEVHGRNNVTPIKPMK